MGGRYGAAANDCTAALEINPDSAKAFKIRARAYVKLERWEDAHKDFQEGLKIDGDDEQTYQDSLEAEAKAKEMRASVTAKRVKEEKDEYDRKLKESKEAYEAGLKANEEKFRQQRMEEEEAKRKAEEERKERVRKREEGTKEDAPADEPGVPKSHAPPSPSNAAGGGGAEDVD